MLLRLAAFCAACLPLLSILPVQAADEKRPQAEVQVALEVRLLTISEECCERLGVDFDFVPLKPAQASLRAPALQPGAVVHPESLGVAFLSDTQLFQVMQAAQGDRRTNVMQAPRLLISNGQTGSVDVTETPLFLTGLNVVPAGDGGVVVTPKQEPVKLGLQVTAQPQVSADRRFVRLALKVNLSNLAEVPLVPVQVPVQGTKGAGNSALQMFLQQPQISELNIDNTVNIPDGNTALFGGLKKFTEGRNEYGPPILSRIPYLNRLYKNVGYGREMQTLYIMVTPRIIVREEAKAASRAGPEQPRQPCPATRPDELPGELRQASRRVEETTPACVSPARGQINLVAQLLIAYDEACAAGSTEEAERLARAALILNPKCFHNRR